MVGYIGRRAVAAVRRDGLLTSADAEAMVEQFPDGLAIIDRRGRFVRCNPAALQLCGLDGAKVSGLQSPFPVPEQFEGAAGTAHHERDVIWELPSGTRRELAYRLRPMPKRSGHIVTFRDVTAERQQQRRLAAIANARRQVAAKRSLNSTLVALTKEIREADAFAGVQIIVINGADERFQVVGATGFAVPPDYVDRLNECRKRGAKLMMLDAFRTRRPVIVPNRYAEDMASASWAPLHDSLRSPEWDWFACVPLMVRGEPVGVLNAFFMPGMVVGANELDFLRAMAEQAADAVDYASLLEREGEVARREERHRLARDLHDSVVQQVFSMGLQIDTLGVLSTRDSVVDSAHVKRVTDELSVGTKTVLSDLRTIVTELHPVTTEQDLIGRLRQLAKTTAEQTGIDIEVNYRDTHNELENLDIEIREDAYRIVAEALHNSVKHSACLAIGILLKVDDYRTRRCLVATVCDDGCGPSGGKGTASDDSGGFGMTAMSERAHRWDGSVTTRPRPGGGTEVLLRLPLPVSLTAIRPTPNSQL